MGNEQHTANPTQSDESLVAATASPPAEEEVSYERNDAALAQLGRWGAVRMALDRFHGSLGRYPRMSEGLQALIRPPADLSPRARERWAGPYISDGKLLDPWGRKLRYEIPPKKNVGEHPPIVIQSETMLRFDDEVTRMQYSEDRTKFCFFPDCLDLWSVGPDGIDGTDDDIGNWDCYRRAREWDWSKP